MNDTKYSETEILYLSQKGLSFGKSWHDGVL